MVTTRTWIEVRYGNPRKSGALLCRIFDPALLNTGKAKMLEDAATRAAASERADAVLAVHYRGDFDKLKKLLDVLIPDAELAISTQ